MKRIGTVVAMRKEILPFIENSGVEVFNESVGKYQISYFNYLDKEIYIVESGVGEIYAAGATQLLISKYEVECIINFGVCGLLNDKLNLLETVLVDGIVHYDFDLSKIDNLPVGQYPNMDRVIPCKNSLMDVVTSINPSIQKVICASADKFVVDSDVKDNLYKEYDASICEMESAGVALTCLNNNIPFAVIKAVSDGKGGVDEYRKLVMSASKSYVELIYKVLEVI